MADYTQLTFFAPKDALITGNPLKKIKGSEFDPEFSAISTAVATKLDDTDLASNAEAAALSSATKLITPSNLNYALLNASVTLGAGVLLNGGIAASDVARRSVNNSFTANQTVVPATGNSQISSRSVDADALLALTTQSQQDWYVGVDRSDSGAFIISTQPNLSSPAIRLTTANVLTVNGALAWTASNDGSGSGLDADLLDGLNLVSSAATASTVVGRDAQGDSFVRYLNSSAGASENPTISQFMVTNAGDGYVRKASLAHVQSQLGVPTTASGTWTPTVTSNSGSSSAMSGSGFYVRVGNTVHAKCQINFTWSGGAGDHTLDVTLPVASNLGGLLGTIFHDSHLVGSGNYVNGRMAPDTTNDRAEITVTMGGNGSPQLIVDFMYTVA